MSNGWSDEPGEFGAHLRSVNARRLSLASRHVTAVLLLLLVVNLALPELRLFEHAYVNIVCALYFIGLGVVTRSRRARSWPIPVLPLLFGGGMAATGILFSVDLARTVGANPAYSTLILVACLVPVWPRRLMPLMLVPVHLIYLATIFGGGYSPTFVLVMAIGGTVAAALGGMTALLAARAERQSFDAALAVRRQKDELAAALARVESLLQDRREMVAMAAHDLQSPLAGIRALLQTISEVPPPEARKLEEILRTCAQMHRSIAGLIAAHAAETDAEPALENVDVEVLFRRATAAAAAVAADRGITVRHAAHGARVRTAPAVVGGMLDNLLSNALKFSPAGSVVRLEAQQRAAGVRLCVSDSGLGIAAKDVPLLFKKFSRLATPAIRAEPGSGLGLYIVRVQAERIGARAGYAPNPAGGSVFYIDVPAAPADEAPHAVPAGRTEPLITEVKAGAPA